MELCWIPSHIDIHGNEKADSLVKLALDKADIQPLPFCKLEIKSKIKASIAERWQAEWDASKIGRWLYKIQPKVQQKPNSYSNERRIEIAISRLRLSHKKHYDKFVHLAIRLKQLTTCY